MIWVRIWIILLIATINIPCYAAGFMTLEVLNIKPSGTGSPAISQYNRIFVAYPNIEYNIPCAASGGVYPYSYAITANKPSWLSINASTGIISGTAPASGTYSDIEVTVTDAESSTATGTWTITVDATRFKFVDAGAGSNGDGTISSPYQTITYMLDNASTNDIIYFRGGTTHTLPIYHPNSTEWEITDSATNGCYLDYNSGRPNKWLAYPGESPTIDMSDHFIEVYGASADNIWFDGLRITNMTNGGIYSYCGADYFMIRRCDFDGLVLNHAQNDNNGFMRLGGLAPEPIGYYKIIQDNNFHNFDSSHGIGSIYRSVRTLIERNDFYDSTYVTGGGQTAAIALKRELSYTTVRNNTFKTMGASNCAFGHSVNAGLRYSDYTEVCFNLFLHSGNSVFPELNSAEQNQNMYFYRNTIVGTVGLQELDDATKMPLGPYTFVNNVIQNTAAGFTYDSCGDQTAVDTNNLKGTSGLVDASGLLINRSYVGIYGWESGSTTRGTAGAVTIRNGTFHP